MKKVIFFIVVIALFLVIKTDFKVRAAINNYDGDGQVLDANIYWYGIGDVAQKAEEGRSNPYYDPNKPTLIFFDGWQFDSTTKLFRMTFNPYKHDKSYKVNDNLADYWINKGWNVGMFYWNQFSDEIIPDYVEGKIWTNTSTKGLRWRKSNGKYVDYQGNEKSVTEIFLNIYSKVMKDYNGGEIRFAGHSLGSQLAISSTNAVQNAIDSGRVSSKLRPSRVALLDPYWSNGGKKFLGGKWTGELCREYVSNLKNRGIVFEEYKTSNINDLNIGDRNIGMRKLAIFTDIYPDFINFFNQKARHVYAREWYLNSEAFGGLREYYNNILTTGEAPSAAESTEKMKCIISSKNYWTQRDGKSTFTLSDDTFNKNNW